MLLRAIFAFLLLPGIVAFAVPLLLAAGSSNLPFFGPLALICLVAGFTGLIWCVVAFYAIGKGTLAPWAPPQELVVTGLYRFSRNPMYCSVLMILVGWSILFRSVALAAYAGTVAIGFQVRVVYGEEPWLDRTHGQRWREYTREVNRWIGRASTGRRR